MRQVVPARKVTELRICPSAPVGHEPRAAPGGRVSLAPNAGPPASSGRRCPRAGGGCGAGIHLLSQPGEGLRQLGGPQMRAGPQPPDFPAGLDHARWGWAPAAEPPSSEAPPPRPQGGGRLTAAPALPASRRAREQGGPVWFPHLSGRARSRC